MSKRGLSVLQRTPFWSSSPAYFPTGVRFQGVKRTGPPLQNHTPTCLGPCSSLRKWPSTHIRNYTGLCPQSKDAYCCLDLWPEGATEGWLFAELWMKLKLMCSQGSIRDSALWKGDRGRRGEMVCALWTHVASHPGTSSCLRIPKLKLAFEVMMKVYLSRLEDKMYVTEQSVAWFKCLYIFHRCFCSRFHGCQGGSVCNHYRTIFGEEIFLPQKIFISIYSEIPYSEIYDMEILI